MSELAPPNGTPQSPTYPFDEAGLRESCTRAADKLWAAEVSRREAAGVPLHLFCTVTVGTFYDDAQQKCLGFGIDYDQATIREFPWQLIELAGRQLIEIARAGMAGPKATSAVRT